MTRKWTESAEVQIDATTGALLVEPTAGSNLAAKTVTALTKAVAVPGTGEKLVASETFARKAFLQAGRAAAANAGLVYVGTSAVDKASDMQIELAPGEVLVIDPGPGVKIDLATIYVDAVTATDGVRGWYIPV